jgi:hypothetical protein
MGSCPTAVTEKVRSTAPALFCSSIRVISDSAPHDSVIVALAAARSALVVNVKMRGKLDVGSAVEVSVAGGVKVAVGVGVIEGVNVAVGKFVDDGVNVAVLVAVGVLVAVSVGVAVLVAVGVMLGVKVAITSAVGSTTVSSRVPKSHDVNTIIKIGRKHRMIAVRNFVIISHIMKRIFYITIVVMILLFGAGCQPSFMTEAQLPTLAILPTAVPTTLPTRTPHNIPTETSTETPTTTFTPMPTFTLPFEVITDAPATQRISAELNATLELTSTATATVNFILPTNTISVPTSFATTGTPLPQSFVVGYSAGGDPIVAQVRGTGAKILMLVGGIHGGWESNTVELIQALTAHFTLNPNDVVPGVTLLFIASANPDGLRRGRDLTGRFNGNGVDLNRNWGCEWSSQAEWREGPVDPGARAFSEPETLAIATLIQQIHPATVLFYHSAADGIFEGNCDGTSHSMEMVSIYGEATGYTYGQPFSAYTVTGTASNWVDGQGIPAADVELQRWQDPEFTRNLNGVMALQCWLVGESASEIDICNVSG